MYQEHRLHREMATESHCMSQTTNMPGHTHWAAGGPCWGSVRSWPLQCDGSRSAGQLPSSFRWASLPASPVQSGPSAGADGPHDPLVCSSACPDEDAQRSHSQVIRWLSTVRTDLPVFFNSFINGITKPAHVQPFDDSMLPPPHPFVYIYIAHILMTDEDLIIQWMQITIPGIMNTQALLIDICSH